MNELPSRPRHAASARPRVVVVGSGIAGLSAATELGRAGAEVTLVEQLEIAGGRLATVAELEHTCRGRTFTFPIEQGIQGVLPQDRNLRRLLGSCGLDRHLVSAGDQEHVVASAEGGVERVAIRVGRVGLATSRAGPHGLDDRCDSAFDVFDTDAGEALVDPLLASIRALGGTVRLGTGALSIETERVGSALRACAVRVRRGTDGAPERLLADAVVLALDPPALRRLTDGTLLASEGGEPPAEEPSSVVVRLWYGRAPAPHRASSGLLTGLGVDRFFWLDRWQAPFRAWRDHTGGGVLECHLQGRNAREAESLGDDEVRARVDLAARRLWPELDSPPWLADVLRNPPAHGAFAPGALAELPAVQTALANVARAGGGIACDAPASSLERACLTGLLAARKLAAEIGLPPGRLPEPIASFAAEPSLAAASARAVASAGAVASAAAASRACGIHRDRPYPPLRASVPFSQAHRLPPYLYRVRARVIVVDVDAGWSAAQLPPCLEPVPGLAGLATLWVIDYSAAWSASDPTGAVYAFQELVVGTAARERTGPHAGRTGLFVSAAYVNRDLAPVAGRDVYGFPKLMATVDVGDGHLHVRRDGLLPGEGPGLVHPIDLVRGRWRAERDARDDGRGGLARHLACAGMRASSALASALAPMAIYTHQAVTAPRLPDGSHPYISRVLRTPVLDVGVDRLARLREARFELGESATDPLRALAPSRDGVLTTDVGFEVKARFTLDGAELVEDYAATREEIAPVEAAATLESHALRCDAIEEDCEEPGAPPTVPSEGQRRRPPSDRLRLPLA